jgi:hypothetical protein
MLNDIILRLPVTASLPHNVIFVQNTAPSPIFTFTFTYDFASTPIFIITPLPLLTLDLSSSISTFISTSTSSSASALAPALDPTLRLPPPRAPSPPCAVTYDNAPTRSNP